jgi:hypothetical protein
MVAKQRYGGNRRSLYELLTVYGHRAALPEKEKRRKQTGDIDFKLGVSNDILTLNTNTGV